MSNRTKLALGLIFGGIAAAVTGELLGVFSPEDSVDTITDLVVVASEKTYGIALAVAIGLLGWAAYHFVQSYRDHH